MPTALRLAPLALALLFPGIAFAQQSPSQGVRQIPLTPNPPAMEQTAPAAPAAPAPAPNPAPQSSQPSQEQAAPTQQQAAPASGEGAYSWRSSLTDTGASAFIAGCDQCDDVPLDVSCTLSGKDITIRPTMVLETGNEGDLVEVAFEVDRDIFRRDGRLHRSDLYNGFLPEVSIEESDPLLYAMSLGSNLTVSMGPERTNLTLKGSAAALRTMRSACTKPGSTGVPADSASPAPAMPDQSVQPPAGVIISPPPPPIPGVNG
ncbi:DUF1176 domain-containing protein [Afifella sp. IM 167]|uniref:DUF1176 domain-containing protein n=1 Tax=Afifella sp. IM 167 TaxID=2033586 RepID=UPI001CC9A3F6|nr:DUF1176 domain-containing protein [Afifella sp. IM 167]MBZ8135221.1 hypothetical protein [Afifella sp. IM 167]